MDRGAKADGEYPHRLHLSVNYWQKSTTEKEIIKVTSVCDTTVPVLRQTLQDSQTFYTEAQTVANIDAADLSSIKAVLDNAGPSFNIFDQLCVCLNQIFFDFGDLFNWHGRNSLCPDRRVSLRA